MTPLDFWLIWITFVWQTLLIAYFVWAVVDARKRISEIEKTQRYWDLVAKQKQQRGGA